MGSKLWWSLTLLLLLAALLWPPAYRAMFASPPLTALDRQAETVVDAGLKRALAAFALARGLNAVIAVVEGTEVQLAPAGLGLTLTPGQALEPVNDLVERFSWVMLASATALGIQRFLLAFGGWASLKLLLAPALLCLLAGLWSASRWRRRLLHGGGRLVLLALLLRLSLPAVALANHGIYLLFLDDDYRQASSALESGREQLEQQTQTELAAPASADPDMLDRLKAAGRELAAAADVRQRLAELQQRATALINDVLQLILVFVLNTILLPLAFLWGLWRLLRLGLTLPWPIRQQDRAAA